MSIREINEMNPDAVLFREFFPFEQVTRVSDVAIVILSRTSTWIVWCRKKNLQRAPIDLYKEGNS